MGDFLKNQKMRKQILTCLLLTYILASVGVVLNSCRFTFFTLDDYWNTVSAIGFKGKSLSHLSSSVRFAKNMYETWQGTWFSAFLQSYLNPLLFLKAGAVQEHILHLILMASALFFFISIYLVISELVRLLYQKSTLVTMCLSAAFLFAFLNFKEYKENFYWFTGATAYAIPFGCGMIGIFLLLYMEGRIFPRYYRFLAILFAYIMIILSTGGSLQITGMISWILLFLVIVDLRQKKNSCAAIVGFIFALIGALVNTCAPGNYKRLEVISRSKVNLLGTLWHCIYRICHDTEELLQTTPILLTCMAIFAMGIFISSKISDHKKKIIYRLLLPSYLMVFVSVFPVLLAMRDTNLADRNQTYCHLSLMVALMLTSLELGLRTKSLFTKEQWIFVLASITVCLVCMGRVTLFHQESENDTRQMMQVKRVLAYSDGDLSMYYSEVERVLDKLREGKGEELKRTDIQGKVPETMMEFSFMDNDRVRVYDYMANYYGYKEILLK